MSQIPGDYNPQNVEDWSFNVNSNEPSDLSKTGENASQSSESVQENSPVQSFGKTTHTEESVLRSAVLSDNLTEAEFKKSKWKDAIDTTGRLGKLKYKWNKVKSSMHAFISGFDKRRPVGNLKSRAKNAANSIGMFIKNKTNSSLPTSCYVGNKRDSNVSQEMLSLYMDGIELGDLENNAIQGQESNATSISISPLLTSFPINNVVNSNGIESLQIPANASSYSTLNSIVNYGQYAKFNPSEVESQALFRRLAILQNSENLDTIKTSFISPKQIVEEEVFQKNLDANSEVQQSEGVEGEGKANNNGVIRKKSNIGRSSSNKKQEIKKKFQFFKNIPPRGLPLLSGGMTGAWGASSHSSFRLPQSGHQIIPVVNFSSWGKKNRRFLNSSQLEDTVFFTDTDTVFVTNSRSHQEVNTGMSDVDDDDFIITSTTPFLQRSPSKELSMSQRSLNRLNDNQDEDYLVSSAYSFAGFSGFAAESMQKKEEEQLLAEQQRAAIFANVLVYQYRTIGLNPPIVLRKPSSYASYERPYVVGKPSAEEAHNEQNQEGGYSNDEDSIFKNKEKKDE